jgi:hypothetical protein
MILLTMQRTTFLKLRVSTDEVAHFNSRASALGVSVSQLIRDTALHGAVFVALEKSQAGFELRRLGAMLKHMYPAVDVRWTDGDRDRWWALINELRESADKLEAMAISGKGAAAATAYAG